MTKEPADWAKIKAHRVQYPEAVVPENSILEYWYDYSRAMHELARMYDKYEQPPVDPDLRAARKWAASVEQHLAWEFRSGLADSSPLIEAFRAGIKHGRANP